MTPLQFLQKERIGSVEGLEWWSPDCPVLTVFVPCGRASFGVAGQVAPSLYLWTERSGRFIPPSPRLKRTSNSCLLMPEIIPPASSLEEEWGEEEEEPSAEMPRQCHCLNKFRPASFDDNDLQGGQRWAYPRSYALSGQTLGMAHFWTVVGSFRSQQKQYCLQKLFLPCILQLLLLKTLTWNGLAIPLSSPWVCSGLLLFSPCSLLCYLVPLKQAWLRREEFNSSALCWSCRRARRLKWDQQLPNVLLPGNLFIILLTPGTSHFETDLSRKLHLLSN